MSVFKLRMLNKFHRSTPTLCLDTYYSASTGIPKFVACPDLGESEDRCEPGEEIPFYTDGELGLQVDVKYIGAGKSGSVFEIVGFTVSRDVSETLMMCTTMVPSDNNEPVNFDCYPVNGDVEGRINGSVSTDRRTYVNASFVINPASVDDSGDYTVRVTARDMSEVTDAMASTVTMGTTHTTITLVVSASATVHPRKYEGACGSYSVWDGRGVKCGALGLNEEECTCM